MKPDRAERMGVRVGSTGSAPFGGRTSALFLPDRNAGGGGDRGGVRVWIFLVIGFGFP